MPTPAFSDNAIRINDHPVGKQYEISASVNSRGVLLAEWIDTRAGYEQCAFSLSYDNGVTWETNQLYNHPGSATGVDPVVTTDSAGNLYQLCMATGIENGSNLGNAMDIRHSTDDGHTWSEWTTLPNDFNNAPDKPWMIGGKDGTIYLAAANLGNSLFEIDFMKSTDYGKTWGSPKSYSGSVSLMGAFMGTDNNGDLFFSWSSYGGNVQLVKSSDAGATFTEPVIVGAASGAPGLSFLAVDPSGSDVYVVAAPAYGFADVWLSHSTDGGKSWAPPVAISSKGAEPSVVVSKNGQVHLMWSEETNGQKNHVLYATSKNQGLSFSAPIAISESGQLNDAGQNGSYQSLVITDDGQLHPFWDDGREGHPEVFTSLFNPTIQSFSDWTPSLWIPKPSLIGSFELEQRVP